MERRARIIGTGRALPDKILTNADLEKMVETSDEWITTRTGIKERHIAAKDEVLSTFAHRAAVRALDAAGADPKSVDLILMATVTPDQPIPSTACAVQHMLGAVNAAAFDLTAGCTGFIYALSTADQFIRSGKYDTILVIGGEVLSKYVDWTDRGTCIILADGAGAFLLRAERGERGILETALYADGSMRDFIEMPGGGGKHPPNMQETLDQRLPFIKMKGNETFKIAVRNLTEVSFEVLRRHNLTPDDIDWLIPHQANLRIIDAVGERLGIPREKVVVNIQHTGNTSSGSIPIAADEIVEKGLLKENQVILASAFGAGLTWGGALIRW
jgi:3-oxoacyl-[acyl-carrier-protein] synthase III